MGYIVTLSDKATGDLVDRIEVAARHHITNFQAMIFWKGITRIAYGDTMDVAIQSVFDEFRGLAVLSQFDIRLVPMV
jgi:hypothetical protein